MEQQCRPAGLNISNMRVFFRHPTIRKTSDLRCVDAWQIFHTATNILCHLASQIYFTLGVRVKKKKKETAWCCSMMLLTDLIYGLAQHLEQHPWMHLTHVAHPAVKGPITAASASCLITRRGRPLHVCAPGHPFITPVNGRNNSYFLRASHPSQIREGKGWILLDRAEAGALAPKLQQKITWVWLSCWFVCVLLCLLGRTHNVTHISKRE